MSRHEGGRSPDVRQSFKDVALGAPIAERRVGPQPVVPPLVLLPDTEQPVGRFILQRTQHDAVQDGENDGGSADAQPESQHRNEREEGRPLQRPQRITEVLEDGVHHSLRSATIGSTRVARRAGTTQAASAKSMRKRWNSTDPSRTSSMVRTRPSGTWGSVARIVLATIDFRAAGSPSARTTR